MSLPNTNSLRIDFSVFDIYSLEYLGEIIHNDQWKSDLEEANLFPSDSQLYSLRIEFCGALKELSEGFH